MKTNPDDNALIDITTHEERSEDGQVYGDVYTTGGLTKREYFAGLAMQGLLSNSGLLASPADELRLEKIAVNAADDLIAELNKENKNG